MSSVPSAAKAVVDHLRLWQDSQGKWASLGVCSTGTYAPKGLVCSVPVTCKDFRWTEVPGLQLSEHVKGRLAASVKELEEEGTEAGVWP
jgi:malate/lactate dehydrogenase